MIQISEDLQKLDEKWGDLFKDDFKKMFTKDLPEHQARLDALIAKREGFMRDLEDRRDYAKKKFSEALREMKEARELFSKIILDTFEKEWEFNRELQGVKNLVGMKSIYVTDRKEKKDEQG